MTRSVGARPLTTCTFLPSSMPSVTGLRCASPSLPTTMTDFEPSSAVTIAESGTFHAWATVLPVIDTLTGVPTLSAPGLVVDFQPDLDGGRAGVERGADHGDLGRDGIIHSRHMTSAVSPTFNRTARLCAMCILASNTEVSITVINGVPAGAVSPANRGPSVTTPSMGLRISE